MNKFFTAPLWVVCTVGLLYGVFFVPLSAKELPTLSVTQCQYYLNSRTFVSGEEFLQLFSILYSDQRLQAYKINSDVLDSLGDVLQTYFSLQELDSIVYADNQLSLYFNSFQKVPIPNLYRQAYIYFSQNLVLAVTTSGNDDISIAFDIVQGEVRITTSWLLEMFTPFPIDTRGTGLFYYIDEKSKISKIGMRQDISVPYDSLTINVKKDIITVQAAHPDMPELIDLWFRPHMLYYFGFTVKLPAFNYIECSGYNREFKPEAHQYFKQILLDVFRAPKNMLSSGVTKHQVLTYFLEQKRAHFWQEFEFGQNE